MNSKISEVKEKILHHQAFTKEDIRECQNVCETDEEVFTTYWIMSRYYLNRSESDALTYCALKCFELNEKNHFELEYSIRDYLEARCDFMEEAIEKTRKKILPLSILFGVLVLILIWLIMSKGELFGFVFGVIGMNVVSIMFQSKATKKTIESFKKKQYAAVYYFLDDEDKKFADKH